MLFNGRPNVSRSLVIQACVLFMVNTLMTINTRQPLLNRRNRKQTRRGAHSDFERSLTDVCNRKKTLRFQHLAKEKGRAWVSSNIPVPSSLQIQFFGMHTKLPCKCGFSLKLYSSIYKQLSVFLPSTCAGSEFSRDRMASFM